MNTKSIPAILALIAGFVTCVMSFVQHVDAVVFAKNFVIVCLIFYVIGTVISIVINMNFKEMTTDEETDENEEEISDEDEQENVEVADDDDE